MKIELKEITVHDLSNGYKDNAEDGVVGFGGNLTFALHTKENLSIKINKEMQ